MEPEIRIAEPSDAKELSALAITTYTAAFGDSMPRSDLEERTSLNLSPAAFSIILSNDVVVVAQSSRGLIGFVQFGRAAASSESGAQAELRRLYVLASHQNRGVGSRLMEAALAHPLLAGAQSVVLDVWQENVAAQRFYGRYGFRVVGEREFELASGAPTTPDLVMVRVASPAV